MLHGPLDYTLRTTNLYFCSRTAIIKANHHHTQGNCKGGINKHLVYS